MEDGKWKMGNGRWEMGNELLEIMCKSDNVFTVHSPAGGHVLRIMFQDK